MPTGECAARRAAFLTLRRFHEEHEAAENDPSESEGTEPPREDGSNVVNVDFTRKK